MEQVGVKLGLSNCFHVDVVGLSGGLTILWNDRFGLTIIAYSKYHIDACLNTFTNSDVWSLTCIMENLKPSCTNISGCFYKSLLTLPIPNILGFVLGIGTTFSILTKNKKLILLHCLKLMHLEMPSII